MKNHLYVSSVAKAPTINVRILIENIRTFWTSFAIKNILC